MEDTTTSDDACPYPLGIGVVYDIARPYVTASSTCKCRDHDRCLCGMDDMRNGYNKDDFLNKLIAHEGLRLDVYKDTLGINTVGNLDDRGISKEELDWMDIPSIDHIFSDGITEADAMYLAQNDVQIVEEELSVRTLA